MVIPTNIVTGFLGSGKTTAITHLLKHKPATERWAVLVNEFGEIGIDGELLSQNANADEGVFIREVPGGCLCCAAGLPMQIALNQLIQRAKPQRLLIEPTGLGHPKEILKILSSEYYQGVLSLQRTMTLVDARKISDQRYTSHPIFNQQIEIADIIVANKSDLYPAQKTTSLIQDLRSHAMAQKGLVMNSEELDENSVEIVFTEYGNIPVQLLEGPCGYASRNEPTPNRPAILTALGEVEQPSIPPSGFLRVDNGDGQFKSIGWRFSPEIVFDRDRFYLWVSGLSVQRLKAVVITEDGIFGYNVTEDTLSEMEFDDCDESRVELICENFNPQWENDLLILAGIAC